MFNLFSKRKKGSRLFANSLHLVFAGSAISHIGCIRPNNEDNYILGGHFNHNLADYSAISASSKDDFRQWKTAGVFDGMGGGEYGEIASCLTAKIFLEAANKLSGKIEPSGVDQILREAFLAANNEIVKLQKQNLVYGTTGTILCTDGRNVKIYHLGDSRAYLIRGFEFLQLTKDHTLAQLKRDTGVYLSGDSEVESDRHKLTNYIGKDASCTHLKPTESQWIPLEAGDKILLCSDGLCDLCGENEMKEALSVEGHIEETCKRLIGMALERGGQDNITCVLLSFIKDKSH